MTARIGSAERLAEVRLPAVRTEHATATMPAGYADRLRRLDLHGLDHEAQRLDGVPTSAVVTEMRTEVELERAGRRWRAVHAEAARIGWRAALARHSQVTA